jgi:hypothetical protein
MNRAILLAATLLISTSTFANPITCDAAKVEISFRKSVQFPDTVEAVLSASIGNRSTVLRYDGNIDFIGAECRKTKQGTLLVVFQAYCGGSGCKDLGNYGIIDPKDLRVLLVPNDWNHSVANKIFGSEAAPIERPLSVNKAYEKLFAQ